MKRLPIHTADIDPADIDPAGLVVVPKNYQGDFTPDPVALKRLWFLTALEVYPAPPQKKLVLESLHDLLGDYLNAKVAWQHSNPDYREWKTLPWPISKQVSDTQDRQIVEKFENGFDRWARGYHLLFRGQAAEWIRRQTYIALHLWASHPGLLKDVAQPPPPVWPGIDTGALGRGLEQGLTVRLPDYDPQTARADEYLKQCREYVNQQQAKARDLGLRSTHGLVKCPYLSFQYPDGEAVAIPQHVIWLVRFQVYEERKTAIVSTIPDEKPGLVAINHACKSVAEDIGITLRKDRPGPLLEKKNSLKLSPRP